MTSGIPWWLSGKEPACQCRRHEFDLGVGKIPWRKNWQPAPVSLPGKSHGQRSLAGHSPWGHRRVGYDLATEHGDASCLFVVVESLSCVWLFCDPMNGSLPDSSVHGISQARKLERVAISFSEGSSPLGDWIPGFNPCLLRLLHWQANSLPLSHLGSQQVV